jgi:hypothetical protein
MDFFIAFGKEVLTKYNSYNLEAFLRQKIKDQNQEAMEMFDYL